jgi:DNA-binding transcriptional LysR family regulator
VANDIEWDNFRYFLAVARAGSANRAADNMGVSHTTVTRRLQALEAQLETTLFRHDRGMSGLSETGRFVYNEVLKMESAIETLVAGMKNDLHLDGSIRVNVTEGLGTLWLIPAMAEFQLAHPNLQINWQTTSTDAKVVGQDTDVAVWWSMPQDVNFVRRKIGSIRYSLYSSPKYIEKFGIPTALDDLANHKLLQFNAYELNTSLEPWNQLCHRFRPDMRLESSLALTTLFPNVPYITLLPDYIVHFRGANIQKIPSPLDILIDVWVLYHEKQRENAVVRAIAAEFARLARQARGVWFEQ